VKLLVLPICVTDEGRYGPKHVESFVKAIIFVIKVVVFDQVVYGIAE
jgi:hypothetical protein